MSAFAGLVSWNKCDGSNSPCPIVMQNHRSYHLSREKFDRGLLSTRDRLQRFCAQRIASLRSSGALRTVWQTLPINCVPTSKNSQLAYATFESDASQAGQMALRQRILRQSPTGGSAVGLAIKSHTAQLAPNPLADASNRRGGIPCVIHSPHP